MHLDGWSYVQVLLNLLREGWAFTAFLFQVKRVCFPSVIQFYWVGSAIATVTGLFVVSPYLCQKIGAQEASTGHWKGPYPWPFGRDPNSSVTRRDSEWPTERKCLGYVCNPHSLKEGTETSRALAMAGSPAWLLSENLNMCCTCCLFILMLWSATVGSNNLMPMCIGSFSYTRSGLVSISEIPI